MNATLSLRSTALRPLLEAFSTGAGTRFGLNIDCLEVKKRQLLSFVFGFSPHELMTRAYLVFLSPLLRPRLLGRAVRRARCAAVVGET